MNIVKNATKSIGVSCNHPWYKPKLLCHSKIRKATNHGYRVKVHIAIKNIEFFEFFKISNWSENYT